MPNRYQRDELIRDSLDMAQVASLKVHDCPNGVVQQNAYAIGWLQDIIDWWYHKVPFSSGVTDIPLNIPANTTSIPLPSNFILDVRDGYLIQKTNEISSRRRLKRLVLQKWLSLDIYGQGRADCPVAYMVQGSVIKITPMSNIDRVATLWYYFLPPILQSDDKPIFPSDYVIKQYIFIRAREWSGEFEPGTAQKFCDKMVTGMKVAGLMNEPESDIIVIDDLYAYKDYRPYAWMGER